MRKVAAGLSIETAFVCRLNQEEIQRHNTMVEELWEDFEERCNERIPIVFAYDEQFQLPLYGTTYRKYYGDPDLMADVQLSTAKWWMNNVVQDSIMGLPKDNWIVHPQLWMAEKEFFGCEIVYQENDYAWARPMTARKQDLISLLWSIDPAKRLKENTGYRFYKSMKARFQGRRFCGIPIEVEPPNGIAMTHGIFTTAAEIRGHEKLCVDMARDPEFAKSLLDVITEKTLARMKAWHELAGDEVKVQSTDTWSMADDSICILSPKLYEEFVLPFHERVYSEMTTGIRGIHLCGHAQHLFSILHSRLRIGLFDGPGPWIDLGWMRDEFGTDVRINAQVCHQKLKEGGPEAIETMVRDILTERAKRGGQMVLMGYAVTGTRIANLNAMYAAGLKHGGVPS